MSPLPIIVIDDDPGTRETLSDILTGWGYQARIFEKGKEAIKALEENPLNLLLTDIKLPDISGLEVMQIAREINPDIAIVIMTGHASVENAVWAINQGANAYIVKPFNLEELRAILKKALREVRLSQENKQLIDRLQLTNRNVEMAKRELEKTNAYLASLTQEMEDLLHIVSHDLKSPLINIQGFTSRLKEQLASNKLSDPAITQSFAFIQKGVFKMDQMIQSLLHLSRIGRQADPFEKNDLNQMIQDIRDVFSHQLGQKKIEFVCNPLPCLYYRANEINQVFSNLIANAINYMGEKSPKKIEIRCISQEASFLFSVRDTGIGIEEKNFERIFKIFSRLGGETVPGEGLGLAIVRKIIHGHGGKIWVESEKGKGSTFNFTLPKKLEAGG